ncbi:MAG: endonuclease/exonuclease/phosphatase family protein [Phycisphaerales bacterium]|nr:endonuclease/exonuclease/phosphatase family protein [Phycisphaerales bacterium]
MTRNRSSSMTLLLTLLACLAGSCSTTEETNRATEPMTVELRMATYNIKHGLGMDGRIDLERTGNALAALDADIIAIQEVDQHASRSGDVDQAAWLANKLGMHAAFGGFMDFQGGRYGLAILSRYPIEDQQVWRLPDGHEPRVALAVRTRPFGWEPVTVVGVHFDWVADDRFRHAQATETIRRLESLKTPWVVLGDFNDTSGSRTMRDFQAIGTTAIGKPGSSGTFPSDEPRKTIDFILAGPRGDWTLGPAEVAEETMASDHRPVGATIRRR